LGRIYKINRIIGHKNPVNPVNLRIRIVSS